VKYQPHVFQGDTQPKIETRYAFWNKALKTLNQRGWRKFNVLALAGPDVGDFKTLTALGVPYTNITLAERQKSTFHKAEKSLRNLAEGEDRFLSCLQHCDVKDVKGKFHVYHFDFCGYINPNMVKLMHETIGKTKATNSPLVGVGISMLRDGVVKRLTKGLGLSRPQERVYALTTWMNAQETGKRYWVPTHVFYYYARVPMLYVLMRKVNKKPKKILFPKVQAIGVKK